MKRVWIPAVVLAFGPAALAPCQEGAAPAAAQPRIAVIDMNQVFLESTLGKGYQKSITDQRERLRGQAAKLRAEVDKRDEELAKLQQELQTQRGVWSEETVEEKELEARRKERDRNQLAQDSQEQFQLAENEANRAIEKLNGEFTQKITPYIEAVVRARGINLLIHRATVAFADASFDISKDVVTRADEGERAKPAAAAPAAPPSVAPAKKAPAAKR